MYYDDFDDNDLDEDELDEENRVYDYSGHSDFSSGSDGPEMDGYNSALDGHTLFKNDAAAFPHYKPTQEEILLHKLKKQKIIERKQWQKNNRDMLKHSEKLWSRLQKYLPKQSFDGTYAKFSSPDSDEEGNENGREKFIQSILDLWCFDIYEFILKGDGYFVIETCLSFADDSLRWRICEELLDRKHGKDAFLRLAKARCGRSLLFQVFRCLAASKMKDAYRKCLYSHVIELSTHNNGIRVLNMIYRYHSKRRHRRSMREVFYGPQFALIRAERPKKEKLTLDMVFLSHPDKKPLILQHLHDSLLPAIEKGILQLCPFSNILALDYLENVSSADETARGFLLKVFSWLTPMSRHHEGTLLGLHCISHLPVKDIDTMLKSMMFAMGNYYQSRYQYLIVLRFMDCVGIDIELIKSAVLQEYLENLKTYLHHFYARRIVLYMIVNASNVLLKDRLAYFGGKEKVEIVLKNREKVIQGNAEIRTRMRALLVHCLPKIMEFARETTRGCLFDVLSNEILMELIIMDMHELCDDSNLSGKGTFAVLSDLQTKLMHSIVAVLIKCNLIPLSRKEKMAAESKRRENNLPKTMSRSKENFMANAWLTLVIKAANAGSKSAIVFVEVLANALTSVMPVWATNQASIVMIQLLECSASEAIVRSSLKDHLKVIKAAASRRNRNPILLAEKLEAKKK